MADIQYLNYGDQQIEQQALLNNLANNVQDYVQKQSWSNKRKEMFMSAYSDLMNKGILGASNNSGQWVVNVSGDPIDLDSKSKKEKEMYQEAAYFIQQQMAGLPTKANEEEKKKEELVPFDNFQSNFGKYLSKTYYGGNQLRTQEDWNVLDERDPKTGLRGNTNRIKRLSEYLQNYSNSLEEGKYDFKDSPFTDLNDLKTRINTTVTALNDGTWDQKDTDALNAIGLRREDWFNNGSGDSYKTEGYEGTYGEYYNEYLPALEKKKAEELATKQKAEAQKQAQIRANQYSNMRFYGQGLNGKITNNLSIEYLNQLAQQSNLDGNQQSEIVGAFKLAAKNNALQNLSKEELEKFGGFSSTGYSTPGRLKKIEGVNGLYWDTYGKRVVQPYNQNNVSQTSFDQILKQNTPEALKEQKINTPRQLSDGLEYEDYARITAALGDVISLGGFGANIAGSIVSLFGDTTADIADDKVSTWEAFKNFGKNLGWTAAGFIPGGKLGKVAKNIMRWAPKMLVVLNDYNLLNDESNKNTWNKLTNESKLLKEGLNDEDLKNITYWIRAFTGTANAIKATGRDIKYSKARGTQGQKFKTKDGQEVQLSNKDVQDINAVGARKGQKAAEDLFKSKTGKEIVEGSFKFSENGRSRFANTRSKLQDQRLQGETVVFRTPEQQKYYDLLKQDRNLGGYGGWRPFWQRGTSSYFDHFDSGGFKNPLNGVLRKTDPYKNIVNSQNQPKQNSQQKNNNQQQQNQQQSQQQNQQQQQTKFTPENRKNIQKAKKEMEQILNPTRSRKAIKVDKNGKANIEATINGEKISIEYNKNKNELIINNKEPIKVNDGFEIRQKVLSEILGRRANARSNARQNKSINKFNIDINELKKLKKAGFLKHGGTIDKQKIQKYKEFINK